MPNLPFLRRIREALQQNPALIDFASGELSADLAPIEEMTELMGTNPYPSYLGYDHPQGYMPLRQAVASYLNRYRGIQATESSILITSGSQQSLYLITQCLLSPGDAVAIEDPSYHYSLPMFQSAGLRLVRLPADEEGILPEEIRSLHKKHRIKMIFVNPNFQNPTGTLLSDERRGALLEVASELGLPIVEDDPYSLTDYAGIPRSPLKSMDQVGSILHIGSFSKMAAVGLRVGWMVAPIPSWNGLRMPGSKWISDSASYRSRLRPGSWNRLISNRICIVCARSSGGSGTCSSRLFNKNCRIPSVFMFRKAASTCGADSFQE